MVVDSSDKNKERRYMIAIGLDDKKRSDVALLLNTLLANEFVLYAKTLKFHWNVRGKHFGALHKLFEGQYEQILDIVDRVAERVRALGGLSLGTLQEFIAEASLPEEPGKNPDDLGMIRLLLEDHEFIARFIRECSQQAAQVHDEGTVNMLGDLIETHEKIAWMLRSHLE